MLGRELTGIVIPGRGLGSVRMADPVVLERAKELAGFPVVPGTLNVRLPGPFDRARTARYLPAADIGPGWEAETGQAGYYMVPVLVAKRYRGLAFQADEPGYPDDLLELLCEVRLRETLGLCDGDTITLSLT